MSSTGKALIVYYSISGNTEKVALAIQYGCRRAGLNPTLKFVSDAFEEELLAYDFLCIGAPVIHGFPPNPMMRFLLEQRTRHSKRQDASIDTQKILGKNALVFVTYSGPHIGVAEAIPAGKYIRQDLEHLGFDVKDEWYVVGEFHGWKAGSTRGKLGDIRGRPNAQDLAEIEKRTTKLIRLLMSEPAQEAE